MIINTERDVTAAVLAEAERASDERFREILKGAVRHLHDFVREVRLTETEFHRLCSVIARAGQLTSASHNEVVLAAGSLGVSSLVCLLNNSEGARPTTANLLGPFWRAGAPILTNGASLLRGPTRGDPIFVTTWVRDIDGGAVAGACVDVWHSSAEGFYENQDPEQADLNLRGTFETNAEGKIWFRSIKPRGYPIPVDGPVGDLLRAQRRHNLRPAHIHFLISKRGYKTQFSQVYSSDDPNLDTDVQFGVTEQLIGHYRRHEASESAPASGVTGPWYSLEHSFVLLPGVSTLPRPPITGKATGPRPQLQILRRD
jgi:hydroxyquinol 1,2-dioxygenase